MTTPEHERHYGDIFLINNSQSIDPQSSFLGAKNGYYRRRLNYCKLDN